MKKLTLGYVKEKTKKWAKGYKCLSKEYINAHVKLKFRCNKGHIFYMTWCSFQQGSKCAECAGVKKYTIEYIKQQTPLLAKGYKCLSKKYININTKLRFRCNNGHIYLISWLDLRRGTRCVECSGNYRVLSLQYIKKQISIIAKGYECLSKKYTNVHTKLKFRCNNGHIYKTSWGIFHQGSRCPECWRENMCREGHPNWKGGVTKKEIPLFNTYAHQIDWCEEARKDPENYDYLQVRCTYDECRKWFMPTTSKIHNRLEHLKGKVVAECRFYCSEKCKDNCSIFNQRDSPKEFKLDYSRPHQKEWRQMLLERANGRCEICEKETDILIAHHIDSLHTNPIMSADISNGLALCEECEERAHKDKGCRPIDLTKKRVCGKND